MREVLAFVLVAPRAGPTSPLDVEAIAELLMPAVLDRKPVSHVLSAHLQANCGRLDVYTTVERGGEGVHELVARLDAALAANYPSVYTLLGPGSSQEELDSLESVFGLPLPSLYREFLGWRGSPGVDAYPRVENIVGIFGLTSAGYAAELISDLRDTVRRNADLRRSAWWGYHFLPLMQHGSPELVIDVAGEALLDSEAEDEQKYPSVAGQIVQFRSDDDLREVQAPSLEIWLEALARTCERGMFEPAVHHLDRGTVVDLDGNLDSDSFATNLDELAPTYPHLRTLLHFPY